MNYQLTTNKSVLGWIDHIRSVDAVSSGEDPSLVQQRAATGVVPASGWGVVSKRSLPRELKGLGVDTAHNAGSGGWALLATLGVVGGEHCAKGECH